MKRLDLSIGIRIARLVRKAGRIAFWVSAVCMLISLTEPDRWLTVSLVGIAVLAVLVELSALEIGQMLASRAFAAELAADPAADRPMILFLRSFNIARSSLGSKFLKHLIFIGGLFIAIREGFFDVMAERPYGLEEHLAEAIGPNAMFVALGDKIASYGAAKITVKDADWQDFFYRLANTSQLIFMMPGPSKGALWELWQIRWSQGFLEKTVFIMPPEGFSLVEAESSSMQWAQVTEMAAELGVTLPPYSPEGCYFRLRDDGQPAEIVALEPFTRALGEFVASPAYTGLIKFSDVLKLV